MWPGKGQRNQTKVSLNVETSRIMNTNGYLLNIKLTIGTWQHEETLPWCMQKKSNRCVGLFDFFALENKLEWLKEGFVIFHSDSLTQMESLKTIFMKSIFAFLFSSNTSRKDTRLWNTVTVCKVSLFYLFCEQFFYNVLNNLKTLKFFLVKKKDFWQNISCESPAPADTSCFESGDI